MNAPAIVWFRLDLRRADNPALAAAVAHGGPVIPLFIWAPAEEGVWPPGAASRWWLHHSLAALEEGLGGLVIRRGPSVAALRDLIRETGATAVFWNRRYEPALIARDTEVKQALLADGVHVASFNSALLFEPWEIKNKAGNPFQVFTPFYKTCLNHPVGGPRSVVAARFERTRRSASLRLEELALLPKSDWTRAFDWTPGEAGAHRALKQFVRTAERGYVVNRDLPAVAGTSRLAPHLHFGEISPWQVWAATSNEPFRRQLIWREFAHHLLYHFPHTADAPLRPEFVRFPWRDDPDGLRAWQRGQTGFPIVDAGMRELWTTGWMHNRVRMIVGSFLVKDLLLPWQTGARWFWDTLVDADLANNTLGWQWVAGSGADAAPFFRIFNPALQAAKFDPTGDYVRRWTTAAHPPILNHATARTRALAALRKMKAL